MSGLGLDFFGADFERDIDIGKNELALAKEAGIPVFAILAFFFDFGFDDTDAIDTFASGRGGARDHFGFKNDLFDLAEGFEDETAAFEKFGGNGRSGVLADQLALDLNATCAVVVEDGDGERIIGADAEDVRDVEDGGAGVVDLVGGESLILTDLKFN